MTSPTTDEGIRVDTQQVLAFAASQLTRLTEEHPDAIPVFTEQGRWHIADDAWAPGWTGGFLARR